MHCLSTVKDTRMNITNVNGIPNHSQVRAEAQEPYNHPHAAWSLEKVAAEPGALLFMAPGKNPLQGRHSLEPKKIP